MKALRILEVLLRMAQHLKLHGIVATVLLWILSWIPPLMQLRAQEPPPAPERAEASVEAPYGAKSRHYPVGTAVDIQLHNKEKIHGQVEKYGSDGFWIRAEGTRKNQKIFFIDVQSIHPRADGENAAGKEPGVHVNFWIRGTGADVRVYQPGDGGPNDAGPDDPR